MMMMMMITHLFSQTRKRPTSGNSELYYSSIKDGTDAENEYGCIYDQVEDERKQLQPSDNTVAKQDLKLVAKVYPDLKPVANAGTGQESKQPSNPITAAAAGAAGSSPSQRRHSPSTTNLVYANRNDGNNNNNGGSKASNVKNDHNNVSSDNDDDIYTEHPDNDKPKGRAPGLFRGQSIDHSSLMTDNNALPVNSSYNNSSRSSSSNSNSAKENDNTQVEDDEDLYAMYEAVDQKVLDAAIGQASRPELPPLGRRQFDDPRGRIFNRGVSLDQCPKVEKREENSKDLGEKATSSNSIFTESAQTSSASSSSSSSSANTEFEEYAEVGEVGVPGVVTTTTTTAVSKTERSRPLKPPPVSPKPVIVKLQAKRDAAQRTNEQTANKEGANEEETKEEEDVGEMYATIQKSR